MKAEIIMQILKMYSLITNTTEEKKIEKTKENSHTAIFRNIWNETREDQ